MPMAAAKAAFRARSTETQRASIYKIKDKHLSSATASAAAKLRRGTSLAAKVGKEAAGGAPRTDDAWGRVRTTMMRPHCMASVVPPSTNRRDAASFVLLHARTNRARDRCYV